MGKNAEAARHGMRSAWYRGPNDVQSGAVNTT